MKGISASEGIGIAKIHVIKVENIQIENGNNHSIPDELKRLETSIAAVDQTLADLAEQTRQRVGQKEAEVFEAHRLFLSDPEWLGQIKKLIEKESYFATKAVDQVTNSFVALFESIEDAYLRERSADLKDVSQRLLRKLLNIPEAGLEHIRDEVILVARDLEPSQTASLDKRYIKGFITEVGNTTSHTAIIARTMGIPAVVGLSGVLKVAISGQLAAIDGTTGEVVFSPDETVLKEYARRDEAHHMAQNVFEQARGKQSISLDGTLIEVAGNIGKPKDVTLISENDGDGIGLFRSEFVFMDREEAPTEEEQYEAYKSVLSHLEGKPVIIRTLDAGGDKHIPYLNIEAEMNPFLGYRAIRICLKDQALFKTQLRALLRASVHGKLKIMFPMIATLDELLNAKSILEEVKAELKAENITFAESIPVGIMIEIPSAAMMADCLIQEADFFSIGTNDLTQYTLAADRMNENLGDLYSTYDPAVIRLVHRVIAAGVEAGKMVGMCGEAASDPLLIPLWYGMGMSEFSVSPSKILATRYRIQHMHKDQTSELVKNVLKLSTRAAVKAALEAYSMEVANG